MNFKKALNVWNPSFAAKGSFAWAFVVEVEVVLENLVEPVEEGY